nr:DUF6538 domain-containing protein [uncultured Roseovarius sp.]
MHLDAYLSRSRHGIFYFRWPLPKHHSSDKRTSLRLSLRTRCPKLAGQLARHLASPAPRRSPPRPVSGALCGS